jgi:uncharacterized protein
VAPDQQERLVPEFQIRLDGSDLPSDAIADLIAVSVQEDVNHLSAFTITLNNWDTAKIDMKWSDADLFQVGKQVEVWMGYQGQLQSMISGEVTGFEIAVRERHRPRLIVRGYDRGHRLTRGQRTTSYADMTDSEIASQIASNHGLSAEVERTTETYKYLLQNAQTDAEFLLDRARRIGYETFVREKKLYFHARKYGGQASVVVSQQKGLLEFYPRLSTMHQSGTVEMRSWDVAGKSAWVGRAVSDDESATMGGRELGLKTAASAFGDASLSSAVHPAASQADADQRALGRLKEIALYYVSAEGMSIGRTDLRAGTLVKVEGMGKRFSGLYYVTVTTHSYLPSIGYRTAFQARRNAV